MEFPDEAITLVSEVSMAPVSDVHSFHTLAGHCSAFKPCNLHQPAWSHPLLSEAYKQLRKRCSPSPSTWEARCSREVGSPRGASMLWRKASFWAWGGSGRRIKIRTEHYERRKAGKDVEAAIRKRRNAVRRQAESLVQENGITLNTNWKRWCLICWKQDCQYVGGVSYSFWIFFSSSQKRCWNIWGMELLSG